MNEARRAGFTEGAAGTKDVDCDRRIPSFEELPQPVLVSLPFKPPSTRRLSLSLFPTNLSFGAKLPRGLVLGGPWACHLYPFLVRTVVCYTVISFLERDNEEGATWEVSANSTSSLLKLTYGSLKSATRQIIMGLFGHSVPAYTAGGLLL